jgi:hypothetical protein
VVGLDHVDDRIVEIEGHAELVVPVLLKRERLPLDVRAQRLAKRLVGFDEIHEVHDFAALAVRRNDAAVIRCIDRSVFARAGVHHLAACAAAAAGSAAHATGSAERAR